MATLIDAGVPESRLFILDRRTSKGLPAYCDTNYSDIVVTVTVFGSKEGSPYTENPGYSDILLTLTLFGHPNTVTVSGEACTRSLQEIFSKYE